jgi:hypothetical protein
VATISSLVSRVRLELGDQGKSFVTQFVADGTTNRFRLNYSPLDATCVFVYQDGVDVTSTSYVEESTGVLVVDGLPADGVNFRVTGDYYRYFTNNDLTTLVTQAVAQHSAGHVDSVGRQINVENLPLIEEYPVVIYATTLALYTLATDASFDIDIAAPDGVSIPRSERYRQLMDMVNARQQQYKDLCVLLGVGMYKIDTFTQEVDDRSYPQRVADQLPTYGDKQPAWPTDGGELIAYQGRAFTQDITFTGTYDDESVSYVAKLLNQRGSVLVVQNFGLSVEGPVDGTYTATLTLTSDETLRLANRTYWSIQLVDPNNTDPNSGSILPVEIKGGNFFTERVSTVVI